MAEARRLHPDFDLTRSWNLDPTVTPLDGESILAYLQRIGFTDEQITYTRRSWGNATGAALEHIDATAALQDMDVLPTPGVESAGSGDFRVIEGYNRLHEHLAPGLDIRFETVVTAIHWGEAASGSPIRIETRTGDTYTADRIAVTLPLGVLQAGRVMFDPPLPASKQAAIDGLTMGAGLKVVFTFDQPPAPGVEALYTPHNPPMWWSPAPTVWVGFCTGEWYARLMADGADMVLQRAFEVFRTELGQPALTYTDARLIDWAADEFALGAYSCTPVGSLGLREDLAAPLNDRVFWAGEATAPQPYAGTVHGAYVTGLRAAGAILAAVHR